MLGCKEPILTKAYKSILQVNVLAASSGSWTILLQGLWRSIDSPVQWPKVSAERKKFLRYHLSCPDLVIWPTNRQREQKARKLGLYSELLDTTILGKSPQASVSTSIKWRHWAYWQFFSIFWGAWELPLSTKEVMWGFSKPCTHSTFPCSPCLHGFNFLEAGTVSLYRF